MVLTDILKRWQLLKGNKAILCTGTDEHGMKIQQAASTASAEPKEFCDKGAKIFATLAESANVSNDHFVRTTDPDHAVAVEHVWRILRDRGYIYASKHEGWYCVSDETFYPESAIERRVDPLTGKTFMASQETGKEMEWTSEPNYHFRLSAFKDKLLAFYKENPYFVVPSTRMNDVVQWVSDGLEDLSVSRPANRLTWGIPVPDDDSQTIYVWLDALVNYITKAGYPWAPGRENALGWPADVQVIGKDIVRFHCIYWPAFLLALDISPPKQILTHAHWTLGKQKMAKSTGNVVNPFFALDRFGVDTMRYYLAYDGGIMHDADYSNEMIVQRYKKGLSGGLGNLVSRITRPKIWRVRDVVETVHETLLLKDDERSVSITKDQRTREQRILLEGLRDDVTRSFDRLSPGAALHYIMDAVYKTNSYLQDGAPWALVKTDNDNDKLQATQVVFHCAEALRIVGILLQPYMPTKASTLLDMLGVDSSRRTYNYAQFAADDSYGEAKAQVGKCAWDSLFPPLSIET